MKRARKLALLALTGAIAMTVCAAGPDAASTVTVAQLGQVLAAAHGERDKKLAQRISSLELSERLSSAELARLERGLTGPKARAALIAVGDASAFLAPPAAELSALPAPDRQTQLQILARTVEYVERMRPKLPDFSATRSTTHFEVTTPQRILKEHQAFQFFQMKDTKLTLHELGPVTATHATGVRLFLVDTWTGVVTYRNGNEVRNTPEEGSKGPASPRIGLTTTGEFGPILSVVVGDASKGEIRWDHWEKGELVRWRYFGFLCPRMFRALRFRRIRAIGWD